MKRALFAAFLGVLFLGALDINAAYAEPTLKQHCEELESRAHEIVEGPGSSEWSAEQKASYIAEFTAECHHELAEEEAAAKREETEAIHREEREGTREREQAAEERARRHHIERQRRRRAHTAARHRREWTHKPTVTQPIAREFARRLMNKTEYSVWTLECGGGRLNRTHWSCRVHVFYHCLRGRIRVSGAGFKDHVPYFDAKGSELRPCTLGNSVL